MIVRSRRVGSGHSLNPNHTAVDAGLAYRSIIGGFILGAALSGITGSTWMLQAQQPQTGKKATPQTQRETSTKATPEAPQPQTSFDFSIRNIMRGPELYGREPQDIKWALDGRSILFTWLEPGARWNEPLKQYRVYTQAGSKPQAVSQPFLDSIGPLYQNGSQSPDGGYSAVSYKGDLFIVEHATGGMRRLTQTLDSETSPAFSADGRSIYYISANNIYSIDVQTGHIAQLTDIRTEDPSPIATNKANTQKDRLSKQQKDLFSSIRDQLYVDSVNKVQKQLSEQAVIQPTYLGKGRIIQSISISPNGSAALIITTTSTDAQQTDIPYFVTESGYTETRKFRSKVGDSGQRYALSLIQLKKAAKPQNLSLFPNDTLASYIEISGWNHSGATAAFLAFRPDNKQRVLYTVNTTGELTPVERLTDTAWVGGPCVTCAGWMPDGKKLWYVSEATGYSHLYTADPNGKNIRQLTNGKWEVRDVTLSPQRAEFIINANKISPFEEQVYRLPANGGELTQITKRSGGHQAVLSPDGKSLANVYSHVNIPPELYFQPIDGDIHPQQLTESPTKEWKAQDWIVPELVMIPASDGVKVPAHMYHPKDFGVEPNGAAVIFVHGAGYLHNVGNFWSKYPREYMFNQLLAKNGYVVLDLDYRASDGYGRDWRTAIYRWMGGRDLQDHVDASKWLTSTYGVPANRVGIYGGSYGGFITLMALFTAPDYFGAGAALRSVTDWAHYNRGYTSNILNLPQNDTLAYRRSSPIYFAEGLRAPLLMAHGMVDVNVHYQDIVRLSQRLIELGKEDWELASYPVEDHAFLDPRSWADEYVRIFKLFERTIGRRGEYK